MRKHNGSVDEQIPHAGITATSIAMLEKQPDEPASSALGTIDQVRELLFGETKRGTEYRIEELEKRLEALRAATEERFAEFARMTAEMDKAHDERRRSSVDEIGSAIVDFGNMIRSRSA